MTEQFQDERDYARQFLEHLTVSTASADLHPLIEKHLGACVERSRVEALIRAERQERSAGEPGEQGGIEGEVEQLLETLSAMIESACGSLGLELRGGVVAGMLGKPGFDAAQRPVAFTEAGIIIVHKHFTTFCHVLAKALSRSFVTKDEGHRLALSMNAKKMLRRVRSKRKLLD